MSKFTMHSKQSLAGLLLATAMGTFSAFVAQPTLLAQAKPTVLITSPGGAAPVATSRPVGSGANCSTVNTGLVSASKMAPAEVALGDTFTYTITVNPAACVGNVTVVDTVPTGASLVSTEPTASVSGSQLTWNLGDLDAGATKTLKVTVKADQEGNLASCATIKADPRVCASTKVGRPQLAIDKSGPATALQGDDVTYSIVVKNIGSAVAKGVVVTDKVPAGLGGPKEVPFTVGDLAPGASKTIPITLRASERGKLCNLAVASAANAPSVQDDACTTVLKPGIKLTKTGTLEQYLGRQATYKIVVANIGDTDHTNLVVTDVAPPKTSIVSAPGASVAGNTATWNHALLKAGESKEFEVTLTSVTPGNQCNTASVAVRGLSEKAEACTLWKGVPGILIELVDDPDPIKIGETTTYTIRITNQGPIALTNVGATFMADAPVDPVSSPQGTVSGKKVTFPVVSTLASRQSITYTLVGKAVSVGQAYNKLSVTADGFRLPIENTEVTTTY